MISNTPRQPHDQQLLSTFVGGLEVIDGLLTQFQHSLDLIPHSKQLPSNLTVGSINDFIEFLYQRLTALFRNRKEVILEVGEEAEAGKDEELYMILNEYKNQNKTLKEARKKLETEKVELKKIQEQLRNTLIKKDDELKEKSLCIEEFKANVQNMTEELQECKMELTSEQSVKEQLQLILEGYKEEKGRWGVACLQKEQLVVEVTRLREENACLFRKTQEIDQAVSRKLEEKENWIRQVVAAEVTSEKLWCTPVGSALRSFMNSKAR